MLIAVIVLPMIAVISMVRTTWKLSVTVAVVVTIWITMGWDVRNNTYPIHYIKYENRFVLLVERLFGVYCLSVVLRINLKLKVTEKKLKHLNSRNLLCSFVDNNLSFVLIC